ncbi:hypothetical protein JIN77_14255 [Verrucomicrobiaceae bacterium R5-34]|nr:hypothetical protein [Verrucomicrobiaceae bacterium R5-34]
MRHWNKILIFVVFPATLLVTFSAWAGHGFFRGTEICTTCGRMQSTSRMFWIPRTTIKETELSGFYDAYWGDDGHDHSWLFASGGGGSVMCAIGEGRHLYYAIRRPEPVAGLELIRKHRGDRAVDLWLSRLLDPELSHDSSFLMMELTDDPDDFDNIYQELEEYFEQRASNAR